VHFAHATGHPEQPEATTASQAQGRSAIEHTNNNKTRAAELLGIDRRTLNRILARERARRRAAEAH
jgi:DNA-binding NtrC family response regulator